jgi:hypothetical protein
MSKIRARIERLESETVAGRGKLVIWRADRGDPEPEHEPDDVVIKVLREERDEPESAAG